MGRGLRFTRGKPRNFFAYRICSFCGRKVPADEVLERSNEWTVEGVRWKCPGCSGRKDGPG